jgi:hypothetical protein
MAYQYLEMATINQTSSVSWQFYCKYSYNSDYAAHNIRTCVVKQWDKRGSEQGYRMNYAWSWMVPERKKKSYWLYEMNWLKKFYKVCFNFTA